MPQTSFRKKYRPPWELHSRFSRTSYSSYVWSCALDCPGSSVDRVSSPCWPPMVLVLGLDSQGHGHMRPVSWCIWCLFMQPYIFQEGILSPLWSFLNVNKENHGNFLLIWNSNSFWSACRSCSSEAPPTVTHTLSWGSSSSTLDAVH